jgi:hypothetical protein
MENKVQNKRAFYNDINAFSGRWLKNCADAGYHPKGVFDSRSITEIKSCEVINYEQCHFFSGLGVWSYALQKSGWDFGGTVWTGSCPCQPFSVAGQGRGVDDPRHLWPAWFSLIRIAKPDLIFGEQVAGKGGEEWFSHVQADLEGEGYAVGVAVLSGGIVSASHARPRIFFVAIREGFNPHPKRDKQPREEPCNGEAGRMGRGGEPVSWDTPWESALCQLRTVDDGTSYKVEATDATRNAIIAPLAELFINLVADVMLSA